MYVRKDPGDGKTRKGSDLTKRRVEECSDRGNTESRESKGEFTVDEFLLKGLLGWTLS